MSKKRTRSDEYKPDYNASCSTKDNFGIIYQSMIESTAFQNLTIGKKYMYVLCRVQAQSEQGRQCLFKHGQDENITYNPKTDFVFPEKHMERFGMKGQNGRKYLSDLIEAGFIKLKEQNKHRRMPNVYSFSSEWKNKI